MLQQAQAEDFVIATGKQYTVREFVQWSAVCAANAKRLRQIAERV